MFSIYGYLPRAEKKPQIRPSYFKKLGVISWLSN